MADDDKFSWLHHKGEDAPPVDEHICDFWTLKGPSERHMTCAAYRVATGLELRVAYSETELVGSKLFRGSDADEQVAAAADAWRLTLVTKGFREIARV